MRAWRSLDEAGHPHVIVDNIDDKHVSVGLTTTPTKGKNHKNYKLEQDPLGEGKTSYMRRQGTVDDTENYSSSREGSMTPKDYKKAQQIGEKAKRKYIERKKEEK